MPRRSGLAVLLLLAASASTYSVERTRLIALDVGEGQSLLLQRGAHGVLVDTGHAGQAHHVLERLEARGVTRLDYLVLTHLHPDHASGYFRIREAFPSATVLDSHRPLPITRGPDMVRWVGESLARDSKRRRFRSGDQLRWKGIEIRPLWPRGTPGAQLNRNSLVLEIRVGPHEALLMGDVGIEVERKLLRTGHIEGPYDILVAGHHGSKGTAAEEFLEEVRPDYSVISIDANNIRGYPSEKTVNRLRQLTRRNVLTTYEDGEICLEWLPTKKTAERCNRNQPQTALSPKNEPDR